MKQKIVAKLMTVFLAFVILFSLCSVGVAATTGNANVVKAAAQTTTERKKRPTYTEVLIEINKKLTPEQKTEWQKIKNHLKNSKSYDALATTAVNHFFEIIEDPQNADWAEMGMETLKSVVNLVAVCYGLGGVSNAVFDGLMNFGENPQSELQILQGHIDDQFDEVHDHLDDIQRDVAALSTQVEDSTKEILAALSDALEADYAKAQVIAFMSGFDGNFNYTQFKNYLYGSTDGSKNPYYYTQAYNNKLTESIANHSSDDIIKENYDSLYRCLASTAQHGDSSINMFYDYLLYNEQSGKESIQRYYYEYLLSNKELLGSRSAEFEALQFTLDLYYTAKFADECIAMCNLYQRMCMQEAYGTDPSADAKYVYGDGQNEYITYGQLMQTSAAIERRQAELEAQMVADVAYILNLEGSVVIEDGNHNIRVMENSDETTFGRVQVNQTIYLNKMVQEWCDSFCFDTDAFTYEWRSNNQCIAVNDGIFTVNGDYSSFEGVVQYRGEKVYTVPFVIAKTPTFNGGSGSQDDPYVISNAEQFNLICSTKDGLKKHYILIDNIDFESVSFAPIGDEDTPFNGHIDGNGYYIENLKVTADERVGLFGYVGPYGVIENLNVKGAAFKLGSKDFERVYAGAIAAVNEGTIFNCYVVDSSISIDETSNLKNKHLDAYAGGIAGRSVGDIRYCKVVNTDISANLVRDYGSESDSKNSIAAYAAGIVAANAENGTVRSCSVDSQTSVSASATSTCNDNFSTRHPYITVRAAGIVSTFDELSGIDDVFSDAVIGKCKHHCDNKGFAGGYLENNCSDSSDPYIPGITGEQKARIIADSQDAIMFPNQSPDYEVTYSFGCEYNATYNCYNDQLYACNEKAFKVDNLKVFLNGEAVEYSIISYYYFDTLNSDVSNSTVRHVTIVFASRYDNEIIVDRFVLPITIAENTAIGLEMSVLPYRTTYDKGETVSVAGGSVVLKYQDGSTKDVTSSVELSYDTSKCGKTRVVVTYGGFSTTYDILVSCSHNYQGTIVDPTCTKIGYTVYTCEHCFDTYKTDFTEKVAHSTVLQNEIAATCTEEGKYADVFCTVCQQIIEFGESITPTGHNYAKGTADAGAHYCKACGHGEEHLFKTTEYETEVLCTCVICNHLAKFDANSREKISKLPRIVVSDAYSLPGEHEITVYLELHSNIGITGAEFSVYFGDELELVSCSYGNILYKPSASAFKVYPDHLNVSLAQANTEVPNPDYKASNTLLKLIFRTPSNAEAGKEYPILVVNKAENVNGVTQFVDKFTSSTVERLDFISVNGKIKVVERLPGDVVGDGTIDLLDAVIISKYSVLEKADRSEFLASMKETYKSFDISYGDVNLDRVLTNADIVQILRYVVGGYEARILAKEFTIKLNYNDGTGKETYISARYDENGEIIMGDLPVVERDGYSFDGWYYGFGKDAVKLEGNYQWNYDAIEQTLYAHYTLNSISFVGNGATDGKMNDITYGMMDEWTVGCEFEKTSKVYFNGNEYGSAGYDISIEHTFMGWALSPDGEVVYKLGEVIDLKDGGIGDLTLYAVWSTKYITLPSLSRTGYTLEMWTTDAKGQCFAGNVNGTYPITANTTLYAKWAVIEYTIVYDGNGATSGNTVDYPAGRLHSVETNWQLVNNGFERTGYHFVGWNTQADRSGVHFDNLAFVSYTYIDTEKDGVVTLYAQWDSNEYIVTFDANGGNVNTTTKKVSSDQNYGVLPVPERTGFRFIGWYTDYSTGIEITEKTVVSVADNQTLYAHWQSEVIYTLESDGTYSATGINYDDITNLTILSEYSPNGRVTPLPVTSIGTSAFYNCSQLQSVVIPNSVINIGYNAFGNCNNLNSISLPFAGATLNGTTNVHFGYIFGASDSGQNNYNVPESLKSVVITKQTTFGASSFYECKNLESINLPSGTTNISDNMFKWCSELKNFMIPSTVTSIGAYAFQGCHGINSIEIPSQVKSIGEYAFFACLNLEQVNILPGLTTIGGSAFCNCSKLSNVIFPTTLIRIGDGAFEGCSSLVSIDLPSTLTGIGEWAFRDSGLKTVRFSSESQMTNIGEWAFGYCTALTSVNLPSSITGIGAGAFDNCTSLVSISIPDSVTDIGYGAFGWCSSLSSFTWPSRITEIKNGMFQKCTSLTSFYVPSGVTSVGQVVFWDCTGLKRVDIPKSVTCIDYKAFDGCTALEVAYYEGKPSEWNSITFGDGNDILKSKVSCKQSDSCFTGDTLVVLENGNEVRIDSLKQGDIIMSWNAITGEFEAMPISLFWNHGEQEYDVISLRFSNEKIVKVVTEHGFFDATLNKYVYIDANNYTEYIGHEFAHMTTDNEFEKIVLIAADVSHTVSSCYSLRTACNDNAIVEGFLTLTHEDIEGFLTYFEFGDDYMYDEEKMQADIEKYGLYSYDDWKDYVSYEEFVALNGQYLTIVIGKGYLTYEDILVLIAGMR